MQSAKKINNQMTVHATLVTEFTEYTNIVGYNGYMQHSWIQAIFYSLFTYLYIHRHTSHLSFLKYFITSYIGNTSTADQTTTGTTPVELLG